MRIPGVLLYTALFAAAIFLGFVLLVGCFPESVVSMGEPAEEGTYITPTELSRKISSGSVVVYDIRAPGAYDKGRIPGSINVDSSNLPEILSNLSDSKEAVIVCNCGAKASEQAKQLIPYHSSIKYLYGGMAYWDTLDNPVIRPLWQLCP